MKFEYKSVNIKNQSLINILINSGWKICSTSSGSIIKLYKVR